MVSPFFRSIDGQMVSENIIALCEWFIGNKYKKHTDNILDQ